jgi:hypothetical protein
MYSPLRRLSDPCRIENHTATYLIEQILAIGGRDDAARKRRLLEGMSIEQLTTIRNRLLEPERKK